MTPFNERATIESKDVSTKLLLDLDLGPISMVVEIFSASGSFGVSTAQKNSDSTVIEYATNINDFNTISTYAISNLKVLPITNLFKESQPANLVVVRTILEKRKTLIINAASFAAKSISPDGILLLVGTKKEGIKSIAQQLSRIFLLEPETLFFKKGVHFIKFTFPANHSFNLSNNSTQDLLKIEINNEIIDIVPNENVFSKSKLDLATQLLIDSLKINDGDKILDIGCGSGIIGIAASKKAKDVRVVMTENDYLSVEAAKINVSLNKIYHCEVYPTDVAKGLEGEKFNLVVSNPPFHQGKNITFGTAEKIIEQSYNLLYPNGKLLIVANIFLPYEKKINQIFGNSEVISSNKSFKVICGTKK